MAQFTDITQTYGIEIGDTLNLNGVVHELVYLNKEDECNNCSLRQECYALEETYVVCQNVQGSNFKMIE